MHSTHHTGSFYPLDRWENVAANFVDVVDDATRPVFGTTLHGDVRSDTGKTVAIIGGGYTGISAALHLAADRNLRVVLLEAGRIGSGPSGKSAGHVCGLQREDDEVIRDCGIELGQKLIAAAANGMKLVRTLIAEHQIPCDIRDGYMIIHRDGRQAINTECGQFGISPYPFILGIARVAQEAGVIFHENTTVTAIQTTTAGCNVMTAHGLVQADYVIAAGGHRMAETIPSLRHLRQKTTELRITTLVTDPIPIAVLNRVMPDNAEERYPFSNDDVDVAYGSVSKNGRIVFGASARAACDPRPDVIRKKLFNLFPTLREEYGRAENKDLGTQVFVSAEKLSYTRNYLPLVGYAGEGRRVLYVCGLGGHGIAAGIILGKASAEKIQGFLSQDLTKGQVFDQFARISHRWLPASEPFRKVVAEVGLQTARLRSAGEKFLQKLSKIV